MRASADKVVKRLRSPKFSREVFNSEFLSETLKQKKMSQSDLAKAIDVDFTTVSGWITYKTMPGAVSVVRISRVLEVPKSSLILRGKKAEEYKDKILKLCSESEYKNQNPPKVDREDEVIESFDTPKFKKISSSRVDDCFNTINDNILLLSSTLLRGAYESSKNTDKILNEILSKQNDLMSICCDMLSRIDALEKRESMVVKRVEESIKIPVSTSKDVVSVIDSVSEDVVHKYDESYIKHLIDKYSPDMEFKEFRSNIMNMAKVYSDIKNIPNNEVLKEVYGKMTRVYGIVFVQLKKEYKEKHGSTAPSTITAVYDNEMYRSIMYSILSDMVGNAVKGMEVV